MASNIKVFKKDPHEGQFQYLGRWVNKKNFRTFVYNEKNEQKLANSYEEFERLIASGLWYSSKEAAKKGKRNDPIRPTSK